jgi:uncharacterized protein (TIGR03435 family)
MEMAFQTRSLDLPAVPESLRSERFDIVTKASGKVVGDQYWDMLRLLPEQRFELKHHTQTKNAQLCALMPVKSGTWRRKTSEWHRARCFGTFRLLSHSRATRSEVSGERGQN